MVIINTFLFSLLKGEPGLWDSHFNVSYPFLGGQGEPSKFTLALQDVADPRPGKGGCLRRLERGS